MISPANDTFDAGATAYDSSLLCGHYVRQLLITSDPVYGSGGTGYPQTWTKQGRGYNGHSRASPGKGGGPFVNTTGTASGNDGDPGCTAWCWRDLYADEVDVSAWFSFKHSFNTTLSYPFNTVMGLVARASGGTITDGGASTAHLLGGTCYVFQVVSPGGTGRGVRFQFLRIVAGVVTRIAEVPTGTPGTTTELNFFTTFYVGNTLKKLRFTCHTVGSTVQLRGYIQQAGGPDNAVLSFDDTSGSRITATGRAGFFTQNECPTLNPTNSIVTALALEVSSFQIATYAGVVIVNDDWTRYDIGSAHTISKSFSPLSAGSSYDPNFAPNPDPRDLICGWMGDLHGTTAYGGRIGRSVDRLVFDSSAVDKTGFYISERIANDIREQDRKLDFEFQNALPSVGSLIRGVGIALRCSSLVVSSQPKACYMAEVQWNETTLSPSIYLYQVLAGVQTAIAQKRTGVAVVRGTVYTLEFWAHTQDTPDPINGPAQLRVYIGGTQIQLVATVPPVAGIFVASDGTVTDSRSDRITNGTGEGMWIRSKLGAACHVFADAWSLGSATAGVTVTPADDQATIAMPHEFDNAHGTFPVPYDWVSPEEPTYPVIDHPMDDDHRYVGAAQTRPRRKWKLSCAAATPAQQDTLLAFLDTQNQSVTPFTFTPPGDDTTLARALPDSISTVRANNVVSWSLDIEEVFSSA